MKYRDLVQFDPVEDIIQLRKADRLEEARKLVDTYVVSDLMADKLTEVILKHLQYTLPFDTKGILIIGNYGTGKSHLMSFISSVAEHEGLLGHIRHPGVREAFKAIAGRFKVIRMELGGTTRPLREAIVGEFETNLKKFGVSYTFPAMDQVTSNKPALEGMMAAFHEKYPDKGLLLVVDEMLDYLRSRDDLAIILDLTFLRELGEVSGDLKLRFMAGVQEALFNNPRFASVSNSLLRVIERYEEVPIERRDIKYVISHRLLRKEPGQLAKIREHLMKFSRFYGDLNRRMDEYASLFPIHPDYVDTLERLTVIEKRHILKTLSGVMRGLLDEPVPQNSPGTVSYDQYWSVIKQNPSVRSAQDIREVYECSFRLEGLVETGYPKGKNLDFARRIIHGLSIHRLTVGDIQRPVGLTAENLRDQLCLWDPLIAELGGDPADDLKGETETALRLISRTVNGQFISSSETDKEGRLGGQFYLDIRKTVDYEANIRNRAESIADHELDLAYFDALAQVLERSDQYYPGTRLAWEYDLDWVDKGVFRKGYIFFGAPNERNTAQPPRDFYLFFLRPFNETKFKDEKDPRDVFFRLGERDEVFDLQLRYYAAAGALSGSSSGTEKAHYTNKTKEYKQRISDWLRDNMASAYFVTYQGKARTLQQLLKDKFAPSDSRNFKDTINSVAQGCLSPHFSNLAPEYPTFKTRISRANMKDAVMDALENIGAFAAGGTAVGRFTKRGRSVLEALELVAENQLRPEGSKYAKHILKMLEPKGRGEALNRSGIFSTVETGVEYMAPSRFRLEPEWVSVILASLVYSGHLVMGVKGKKYDASGVDELVGRPVDDLTGFTHVEKPKDWPVPEMSALFEMVGMAPGLATQVTMGKGEPVKEFQNCLVALINDAVVMREKVSSGFYLFNEGILTEDELGQAKRDLEALVGFLESLRVFSTPAKFKNLAHTSEEIGVKRQLLTDLTNLSELSAKTKELEPIAGYLSQALALLPEDHLWVEKAQKTRLHVLGVLKDPRKRAKDQEIFDASKALDTLKTQYADAYMALHSRARLNQAQDKVKSQLVSDGRLKNLEALSGILGTGAYAATVRDSLADLKPCYGLTKEALKTSPVCPDCGFKPLLERQDGASADLKLDSLDENLDKTLTDWTHQLIDMLEDPTAQNSIALMAGKPRELIDGFLSRKTLPNRVDDEFVRACNTALEGLVRVRLNLGDLQKSLVKDKAPTTVQELVLRLERYLSDLAKGSDKDKIRIVFE